MTEAELAWAAGFFEGEGCIRINTPTKRNRGALMVEIVNTDETSIRFFVDRWPGYSKKTQAKGNRKAAYRWITASRAAARFLEDVLPFFRTEKYRRRARLALQFQAQKLSSHANRTPRYLARQDRFYLSMRRLNQRGTCPKASEFHHKKAPA